MLPIHAFDEVHVVSDLHLGGRPGFQIFGLRAELVGLIRFLAQRPANRSVALVINGDFIDFLAEEPASYFDPLGARDKLSQILDASFPEVRKGLQTFVGTPNRTLIVNVGNHDLEIALPWVRERLVTLLAGDDPAARGRVMVATDGTGIRCRVGAADVLCVHGNEVDEWNVTDHERIRRIARDLVQGRSLEPWIPNAGTQLVIDVMNEIKRTYAFVDLLKPEVPAVVPVLLALDPRMVRRMPRAVPIAARLTIDAVRMATGFLTDESLPTTTTATGGASAGSRAGSARAVARQRAAADRQALAKALLDRAEQRAASGQQPLDLVDSDREYLGGFAALWNLATGDVVEAVREALEHLDEDRSFDIREPDHMFEALDAHVGPGIDVLVAGHTHLARALPRRAGRGFYLNSGTWARLIRLTPEVLHDPQRFAGVFEAFKAGDMSALDGANGLVLKRPTFVSVWKDGGKTYAELREYAAAEPLPFRPVGATRFERG